MPEHSVMRDLSRVVFVHMYTWDANAIGNLAYMDSPSNRNKV